jgi:hypothetical protein
MEVKPLTDSEISMRKAVAEYLLNSSTVYHSKKSHSGVDTDTHTGHLAFSCTGRKGDGPILPRR